MASPIPVADGAPQRRAVRANVAYATELRATLRDALWQAALKGQLPEGRNAQLEHLGETAAEGIDLDEASRILADLEGMG